MKLIPLQLLLGPVLLTIGAAHAEYRANITFVARSLPAANASQARGHTKTQARVGGSYESLLALGGYLPDGRSECDGTISISTNVKGSSIAAPPRTPFGWGADWRVEQIDERQVVLHLEPISYSIDSRGGVSTDSAASQSLVLRDGETIEIPLSASGKERARSCGVILTMQAQILSEAQWANEFTYDLWLLHLTPDGQRETRRTSVRSQHGQTLPFTLGGLMLPVKEVAGNAGKQYAIGLEVKGTIEGKLDAVSASRLDTALTIERSFDFGVSGSGCWNGDGVGDSGRKKFTLDVGPKPETVEIVLPTVEGVAVLYPDGEPMFQGGDYGGAPPIAGRTAAPGLTVSDQGVMLMFDQYLRGHRFSLLVSATTTRAPEDSP